MEGKAGLGMIDRRALLGSIALTLAAGSALAQDKDKYPSKAIRLVVSFPPGGPLDVMARLTAQSLRIARPDVRRQQARRRAAPSPAAKWRAPSPTATR